MIVRRITRFTIVTASRMIYLAAPLALFCAAATAVCAQDSVSVADDSIKKYIKQYRAEDGSWTVNGSVIEGHSIREADTGYFDIQMDVRGYDRFTADVGVTDDLGGGQRSGSITVKLNEKEARQFVQRKGDNVTSINLALDGKDTLRITVPYGDAESVRVFNPTLHKDPLPAPPIVITPSPPPASVAQASPEDLDRLAAALWKRVDAKPELRTRLAAGEVALMRLGNTSPGRDAATDANAVTVGLEAALINNNFSLVERGALEQAATKLGLFPGKTMTPALVKRLAQSAGCDFIIVGNVTASDSTFLTSVRLLDSKTGKAVAAESGKVRIVDAPETDTALVAESAQPNAARVRARHILVGVGQQFGNRTEEEARARIREAQDKLLAGATWEDVAKEYSDDTANKNKGGDLGFFRRGQMVKPFEDAAFKAKTGETVGPVQTQFGYHLIQVLERAAE